MRCKNGIISHRLEDMIPVCDYTCASLNGCEIVSIFPQDKIQKQIDIISKNRPMRYEDFLKEGENLFSKTPCRNRLPGGHYCDVIPGKAHEISAIGCIKCKIRVTENTLEDCKKEDEEIMLGE